MNEYSPQVQSTQSIRIDAEPGFGLFDLARFVLGHITVPPVSPASELNCHPGATIKWTKRQMPERLVTSKVLCRLLSRFQTMWSLPPVSVLHFSRKEAGYRAND